MRFGIFQSVIISKGKQLCPRSLLWLQLGVRLEITKAISSVLGLWLAQSTKVLLQKIVLQKWGGEGGRGELQLEIWKKETVCMCVEHSTLNKLSCEVTAVFFHKENYNLKRRCEAISSAWKLMLCNNNKKDVRYFWKKRMAWLQNITKP